MRERQQHTKQMIGIGLITVVIALTWIPYLQTLYFHLSFGDEGYVLESARRIHSGQLPYRDFFTSITPGSYYWSALFMKLFGPSFLSVRVGTLMTSGIILASCCFILKRLGTRSWLPYLVMASHLAYFGGPYWFIASHHWVALASCLLSMLFLLAPAHEECFPRSRYIFAGIMAALTASTMQHLGGIWIIGIYIGFFFLPGTQRKQRALAFSAGILVLALPLAAMFLTTTGLNTLVYDLILFPLTRYHEISAHHSADFNYIAEIWNGVKAAWQVQGGLVAFTRATTISLVFVGLLVLYALPFAGILALVSLWKRKNYSRTNIVFLTIFFCTQYLAALNRISDQSLAFAAPASLLVVLLAFSSPHSKDETRPAIQWGHRVALVLFSATFISALSFHTFVPKFQTLTPSGPIYTTSPAEHQTLQGLSRFFNQRKASDETVFCYPYSPMIYFLFKTDNPTSHDTLVHPMATSSQHDEARNQLEKDRNKWVIITSRIEGDPFAQYLYQAYRPVLQLPHAVIMERKQP